MEFSRKKIAYETIAWGFQKYSEIQDGKHLKEKEPDYWRPFILGFLELFIYPILMFTGGWKFIGAWLSFKTFGQWAEWKTNRNTFNVFLIGNALILVVSYVFMRLWVASCTYM